LKEIRVWKPFFVYLDGLEALVLDEAFQGLYFGDGQLGLDDELFKGGDAVDPPIHDLQSRTIRVRD
jgi:hypothetical protein